VCGLVPPKYSTDWAHGGPLIEVHKISIANQSHEPLCFMWTAFLPFAKFSQPGPTPLIAAMRALVESKIGGGVEL
jgi:hypothetical protein